MSDEVYNEVVRLVYDAEEATRNVRDFINYYVGATQQLQKINDGVYKANEIRREQENKDALDAVDKQMAAKRAALIEEQKLLDQKRKADARANAERVADLIASADREDQLYKLSVDKQVAEKRRLAQNIKSINSDILAADEARIRQEERDMDTSIQRQLAAIAKMRAAEAAPGMAVRNRIAQLNGSSTARNVVDEGEKFGGRNIGGMLRMGAGALNLSGMGGGQLSTMATIAANAEAATSAISGATIAAGAFGAAIIAVDGSMLAMSKDFTQRLSEMSTLLDEASVGAGKFGAELDMAAEAAANMSIKFNRDLVEVVSGFKEALSSGIKADELVAFSDHAGTLAAALNISFKQAANVLTSFKDSYHLTVGELGHINDVLFNTVNVGKVDVDQMINTFGRLLPLGKAAGVQFEDMAAAVATLTRNNMTASQSITGLSSLIEKAISPSKNAKKAFEEMGIAFGGDAFKNGLMGFIDNVKNATNGDLDVISKIFPERKAKLAISNLIQARDLLGDIRTNEIGEGGTANTAKDRSLDNGATKFDQFFKAIKDQAELVGRDLWNSLGRIFFGDGPMSMDTLTQIRVMVVEILGKFEYWGIMLGGVVKAGADVVSILMDMWHITSGVGELLFDIVTLQWDNVTADIKKTSDALANIGKKAAQLPLDLGKIPEELLKASKQNDEHVKAIISGLDAVGTSAQRVAADIRLPFSEVAAAADEAGDHVDALDKKLEALKRKQLDRHARPAQSEALKELETTVDDYETQLAASLRDIEKKVHDAVEAKNEQFKSNYGQNYSQATIDDLAKMFLNKFKDESPDYYGLEAKLRTYKERLDQLKTTIAGQVTDSDWKKMLEDAKKHVEQLSQFTLDQYKKKESREKLESDILKTAEKYYEQDVKNYEKAQEKKKKAEEKLAKDLKKIDDDYFTAIAKLEEKKSQAILNGSKGDPGRQRRVAQDQLENAKTAVTGFLNSGEDDKKKFEALMEAVDKAAEALESAEESINGADRANKNLIETANEEEAFWKQFNATQHATKQAIQNALNQQGPAAPSYQSAAQRAANDLVNKKEERQEVVNVKLNLNIDGSVSQQTVDRIASEVQKALEVTNRQGRRKTPYDNSSWNDPTSDDSSSGD
jgi:TP901 family phage tail tape measure protein